MAPGLEIYLARSKNISIIDAYIRRLGDNFTNRGASEKLNFAIRVGHDLLIATLLNDLGVNGNLFCWRKYAPIHLAALLGQTSVMKILIACYRIDKSSKISRSRQALHIAAKEGHTAIVEQLIRHPIVDVNCRNCHAMTPLHVAASKGHTAIVEQLIRHPNVDVNCQDDNAMTPLHHASYNGHWKTVSLLLRHWELIQDGQCLPSDVSATSVSFTKDDVLHGLFKHPDFGGPNKTLTWRDETLLYLAARKGDCEVMTVLLAYEDIDLNKPGGYGYSPLMTAVIHGQLEAVRLLLQHKDIDVTQRDRPWKRTALEDARRHKYDDIVKLLLSHGAIDCEANKSATVPTTAHINDSQSTMLQPDHELQPDSFDNYADDTPMEDWEESLDMEKEMEERSQVPSGVI